MARLRAAIVGAGLIAGKKHIPAFLRQKRKVELVALCDLNLQNAQNMAKSFGIPRAYGDFLEMLSKEKLDLVDICTPPQTHTGIAVGAMNHGCHVLIEKPMALCVADCDTMVRASRECNVKICVAHSDLFYWPFMRARERVARGEIGDFRGMSIFLSTPTDYITSNEGHWAHRLPGGVIAETGPHVVYMSRAFIGPIREVTAQAVKLLHYPWSNFEDYRIQLIGDRGISSIILSYATGQWAARMEILGKEGILMLDLEGQSIVLYRRKELKPLAIARSLISESAQVAWSLMANGVRFAIGRLNSTHDILLARFVDSIVNGTPPPVTAEEGRETVRVTHLIRECLKESGEKRSAEAATFPNNRA